MPCFFPLFIFAANSVCSASHENVNENKHFDKTLFFDTVSKPELQRII